MNSREKILAIGVGVLLALVGLRAAFSYVDEAFTKRQTRVGALEKEIRDKELEIAKGRKARQALAQWQKRSLPTERQLARSLYHDWLLETASKAGIQDLNLTQSGADRSQVSAARFLPGGRNTRPAFEQMTFNLDGNATLAQIVRLLYEFYSANHLQRIAMLDISEARSGSNLTVKMRIEALLLPGADRRDALNQEKSDRLALADLAAYEKAIVQRDLFAEYKPPRPVARRETSRPPPRPAFDQAKHATVTGITEQGSGPQLWVLVKTTGELLKLAEGEEFSIGDMKCKVVRIGLRDAELATGEKHFLVKLQDNLRDASAAGGGEL